jgi:hypothetical protein
VCRNWQTKNRILSKAVDTPPLLLLLLLLTLLPLLLLLPVYYFPSPIVSISSQGASVASYCNIVLSSLILFTLMVEAIGSSEKSVVNNNHTASHPRRRHSS